MQTHGRHRIYKLGLLAIFSLLPVTLQASFIEATIGTAVVNDATATYFNPAALTLLKNPQLVSLNSYARLNTRFSGQATQVLNGFTQSGTANTHTNYFLPSVYMGLPATDKVTLGLAVIYNDFANDISDGSLLRYVQTNNSVTNLDFVPAIGIKLNDVIAIGGGLTFSYANFLLRPIIGIAGLHVPDSQSQNRSNGVSWGGHFGVLIKASPTTLIGFEYRSPVTFQLSGTSSLTGNPGISSNHYHYNFFTPAHSIFSISHFVNKQLGFITTVQYIQWNIFQTLKIYNVATKIGTQPVIVPYAEAPFYYRNAWLVTLGSQYFIKPNWIARIAATFNQSPSNPHCQIGTGDSITLGISSGYDINKYITLDGSYSYGFIQNRHVSIRSSRFLINGVNQANRSGISLKLTFNVV